MHEFQAATAEGTRDAEADMNGALWFLVGCLGVIGIVVAFVAEPSPPLTRLMGKTPTYAAYYTAAYKSAGKNAQGKQAIFGCLVGTGIGVVLWIAIIAAAAESQNQ